VIMVRVLYFGIVRERLAVPEELYELRTGSTVRDLAREVERRHGSLAQGVATIRFAVNNEYVGFGHTLASNDEVAVIPPVSGGASV